MNNAIKNIIAICSWIWHHTIFGHKKCPLYLLSVCINPVGTKAQCQIACSARIWLLFAKNIGLCPRDCRVPRRPLGSKGINGRQRQTFDTKPVQAVSVTAFLFAHCEIKCKFVVKKGLIWVPFLQCKQARYDFAGDNIYFHFDGKSKRNLHGQI